MLQNDAPLPDDSQDEYDEEEDENIPRQPEVPPEARCWLEGNMSRHQALAGNRFPTTAAALAFVEQLYAAGATGVYVTNIYDERWRLRESGGPYADSLIVVCPDASILRGPLLDLCRAEAEREGLEWTDEDDGDEPVLLWWD